MYRFALKLQCLYNANYTRRRSVHGYNPIIIQQERYTHYPTASRLYNDCCMITRRRYITQHKHSRRGYRRIHATETLQAFIITHNR